MIASTQGFCYSARWKALMSSGSLLSELQKPNSFRLATKLLVLSGHCWPLFGRLFVWCDRINKGEWKRKRRCVCWTKIVSEAFCTSDVGWTEQSAAEGELRKQMMRPELGVQQVEIKLCSKDHRCFWRSNSKCWSCRTSWKNAAAQVTLLSCPNAFCTKAAALCIHYTAKYIVLYWFCNFRFLLHFF